MILVIIPLNLTLGITSTEKNSFELLKLQNTQKREMTPPPTFTVISGTFIVIDVIHRRNVALYLGMFGVGEGLKFGV